MSLLYYLYPKMISFYEDGEFWQHGFLKSISNAYPSEVENIHIQVKEMKKKERSLLLGRGVSDWLMEKLTNEKFNRISAQELLQGGFIPSSDHIFKVGMERRIQPKV